MKQPFPEQRYATKKAAENSAAFALNSDETINLRRADHQAG